MIYTHVAAFIAGAAIASGAVWKVQDWRYTANIRAKEAESARMESRRNQNVADAQRAQVDRLRQAEARANRARAESDGLRDTIASLRPGSTTADTERAAAIAELLGHCSREYQALAGKAGKHVADIETLLQAWPKE